jgi:hypothetical protein
MANVLTNRGWLAAFAAAILCLAAFVTASTALAAAGTLTNVTIGSATTPPNADVTVNLTASGTNIGSYGVNVKYDTAKVTATACTSLKGACNLAFAGDTVRINGADLTGINGTDTVIGSITFHAGATLGTAALTVTESKFSDTDTTNLTNTPVNGTITIAAATASPTASPTASAAATTAAALPKTGGPSSDSSFQLGWLAAAAGALIVVAAGAWTFARAREDS